MHHLRQQGRSPLAAALAQRQAQAPQAPTTRGMASYAVRSVLAQQVAAYPTKNALRVTHQKVRWTFANLFEHSSAFGSALLDVGLRPGKDSVGLVLGCNAEHVSAALGAACAGVKVADVSDKSKLCAQALDRMLKEQACSVLVVSEDTVGLVRELVPELAASAASPAGGAPLALEAYPSLRFVCHTGRSAEPGMHRFRDLMLYNPVPDKLDSFGSSPTPTLAASSSTSTAKKGAKKKSKKAAAAEVAAAKVAPVGDLDAPFFVSIDAATGAASGEMTQRQALEQSSKTADELQLTGDSRVLFKAQKDVVSKLALGALACAQHTAQLVVPSETFDEAALGVASEQDMPTASLA